MTCQNNPPSLSCRNLCLQIASESGVVFHRMSSASQGEAFSVHVMALTYAIPPSPVQRNATSGTLQTPADIPSLHVYINCQGSCGLSLDLDAGESGVKESLPFSGYISAVRYLSSSRFSPFTAFIDLSQLFVHN